MHFHVNYARNKLITLRLKYGGNNNIIWTNMWKKAAPGHAVMLYNIR
jgi:hypothetical protein